MRHLAACSLLSLAGCSAICGDGSYHCISYGAVVVRAVDADTQEPLVDVTVVEGKGGSFPTVLATCPFFADYDAGTTNCRSIKDPGHYHLTVSAPNHADVELEVSAEADSCGHVTSKILEVALQRIGSSTAALTLSSEGCANE